MICAVSFERYGRLYYLDPGGLTPRVGDLVLVPTDEGPKVAAKRLIRDHALPMKVVAVDYAVARNRTTIYFSAEGRVDFRGLVRDLARTLGGRVELRQIGARDTAR